MFVIGYAYNDGQGFQYEVAFDRQEALRKAYLQAGKGAVEVWICPVATDIQRVWPVPESK